MSLNSTSIRPAFLPAVTCPIAFRHPCSLPEVTIRAVRVFDPAVGGDAQDQFDCVFDEIAQTILALGQRRFHLRPLRDLPHQPVVRLLQVVEDP
ncbi:MAG: hypothetical protein B7Z62_08945 [Deltaproteobacteria bacterium 37-65-8]|nr:MAG: hypothetical protein B7Z62_08945 [Deltaproteobacteria bacterium 37-65-8]